MNIACEKCGTTYVLDDNLIPAGGAPVQCTRCSHVFTAKRPSSEAKTLPEIAAAPVASHTMMFASPTASEAKPATVAPAVAASNSTMMFASPATGLTAEAKPASPGPAAAPASNGTMMFASPVAASALPEAKEETVAAKAGPGPAQTMMFASPLSQVPPGVILPSKLASDKTMAGAPPAKPRNTLMFGAAGAEGPSAPLLGAAPAAGKAPLGLSGKGQPGLAGDPTLRPGTKRPLLVEEPGNTLRLNSAEIERMMSGSGSRDAMPALSLSGSGAALPKLSASGAAAAEEISDKDRERSAQTRRHWGWGIFAAITLGVVGLAGYSAFRSRILRSVPPEVTQGVASAMAELRYDDAGAQAKAIGALRNLMAAFPEAVEVHAALVTALAFQLDDVQIPARRVEQQIEGKTAEIVRLSRDRRPDDWELKVNELKGDVRNLRTNHASAFEKAKEADALVRTAYAELTAVYGRNSKPSLEAQLVTTRAQAVFHAVSGSEDAITLVQRFKANASGHKDSWLELAEAEYAVNAKTSPELEQATAKALKGVCDADSTFVRCQILQGRMAIARQDWDAAEQSLDYALTLRPEHSVARELREWIKTQR